MSAQHAAVLDDFLCANGLADRDEPAVWHALTGGVSSEIWRVDLRQHSLCVKRALPKLKVASDWQAPISRNIYEWRWLSFVAEHLPEVVPRPLAHDEKAGVLAMSFLPPEQFPIWKSRLLSGIVTPDVAAQVGSVLGRIHELSAKRPDLARSFDSLDNFHALRLEPYLLTTAARHPELSERLKGLAERTASVASALVHGDVSPKNILIGADGPVFLDAECAWYGDPAFDLAFCLNHLLLKTLIRPDCAAALLRSFEQLTEAYFRETTFEPRGALEGRAAELLPALLLARVDGKSPVEYLVGKLPQQNLARRFACRLLESSSPSLSEIAADWSQEIDRFIQHDL
ncbi:MAG: aminoglycoside phosphotransferase family protein [Gammaproteobacteria bacterium]